MPIHTLQTIPQEPEETPFSGLLQGLAICLLALTLFKLLGPAGILVAAVILLLRRYLLLEDYCEDWAETCCCEQGSYEADAAPPRPDALPQRDAHLVRRVVQSDTRQGVVRPHLRARAARDAGAVSVTSRDTHVAAMA